MAVGDVFRAVGPPAAVDRLVALLGPRRHDQPGRPGARPRPGQRPSPRAGRDAQGRARPVAPRAGPAQQHGVGLTQVRRAGVDLPVGGGTTLHFGDNVVAIGPDAGLAAVEAKLGNSPDALQQTQLIPIFLGICLGVIAGSLPIAIPGMHTSLRIGLAGGPMLVAILLKPPGQHRQCRLVHAGGGQPDPPRLRIAVFLACVGFQSGDHFLQHLLHDGGLPLVGWGVLVSLVPMLLVGAFARLVLRMDFVTLSGLTAGAMTNSPTLLFANEATGSNAPAVAYAAVYPLAMLLPVFGSQLLVTLLMR